jgi:hypothetical protein
MITETGKSIITKYLLGQAPAYASYLALGSGAIPLTTLSFSVNNKALTTNVATITTSTNHNFFVGDYITVSDVDTTFDGIYLITAKTSNTISYAKTADNVSSVAVSPVGTVSHNFTNKESLDFEMFRIPITSRGYVEEDGVSKIVLTGELPTDERYEISEVGIYSAGSNAATSNTNSRTIYAFTTTENWEFHNSVGSSVLPTITETLDLSNTNNNIDIKKATVTSATAVGTSVTYIANNLFRVGDLVTIAGVVSSGTSNQYNLTNVAITDVTNTQFTVIAGAAVTETYTSAGTATLVSPPLMFQTSSTNTAFADSTRLNRHERPRFLNNVIMVDGASSDLSYEFKLYTVNGAAGTVTYTTTLPHNLAAGDVVSIYGVSPAAYNLNNVTIATITSTQFTVTNAATGTYSSGGFVKRTKTEIQSGSNHAHISGVNVNFGENSSTDELRFAFSVLNTEGATSTFPDEVYAILEFASTDHTPGSHATNYAQMDIKLSSDSTSENYYNFDNRYVVKAVELQDIIKANNFTWGVADVATIYACAFDTYTISSKQLTSNVATITTSSAHGFAVGNSVAVKFTTPDATFDGMYTITSVPTPTTFTYAKTASNVSLTSAAGDTKSSTSNYYIALDAIRLENKSSVNPLYGLTGYSVIQNTDDSGSYARPAIKDANTTNFLEFRFTLDVT